MTKSKSDSTSDISTDRAVATVLYSLYTSDLASLRDPTMWGGMFSPCSTEGYKKQALSKALTASVPALEACVLNQEGDPDKAVAKWKKVLEY